MKDHYPKSVVQESIMQSLKGAVAAIARYMDPTTSVAHILQNVMVIFGTVASFNVLMQNCYKVIKGNHDKVPSFTTRLEGTLSQIRLHCPGRITDQEVQQHFKDCLFHGVPKHIRDSIRYLYSNPRTTYPHLMIAVCKGESKNKGACNKVRPWSAMTTEPVEGTTELGESDSQVDGCLDQNRTGQHPCQCPK